MKQFWHELISEMINPTPQDRITCTRSSSDYFRYRNMENKGPFSNSDDCDRQRSFHTIVITVLGKRA